MVPTEDVVQALMEYLVEPLLPIKSSSSPHDQPSIAKQMHAAVLLYNYYHRKQFPKLEYLDMMSFCKVAVNAKPKLLVYLKDTKEINPSGEIEALSITEKAIMDACNISLQLHKLTSMEGSPVSKIAVLLTDSKMENCALVYSGTTKGVWSLIEREDDGSDQCSSWPVKATNGDETLLQKLAMSAVKDTTGINPSELTVLESHVTYSLSEEKTTARFFIMKCQSVIPETFRVPMKDAIDSLQGPLVIKSCNSYTVSDIVGYFHLLPYAAIITEWFSRDMLAKDGNSNNDQLRTVATSERRNGSSDTCQDGKFPVLKTVKTEISDQKKVGDPHIDRHETIGKEVKTSNLSCNKELKTYSRVSADNAVTKLSKEDTDMADAVTSSLVDASTLHSNAVTKQEVPILSGDNFLDCVDPSCPRGDQQVAGSSIGVKRKLADADDLLGHERKQRCPDDDSEIDLNNGSDMSASEHMMNASGENAIVCVAEMNDDRRLLISESTPEDVVYVGHVCFPEKYMALYERIVAKFGDIIIPESKQALLCSDMVSLTMKGLLDVVECISQAATPAIDAVTLESWELKIRFCEVAGLKVEWLRGHLEKLKQVNENAHVGELKSRVVSLEQSLEARRKRAAELRDELEMVLAEERSLAEEKKAADANLEEALRQDCLALCLV